MLFLSKLIETEIGNYIYDVVGSELIPISAKISQEIKEGIFSEDYFEFVNQNGYRDFSKPVSFNIKSSFHSDETFKWLSENKMNSITLCVTENCNLRCQYCVYMSKYNDIDYQLKNMPENVAFKAIDMLMKNSKAADRINIGFYGGEPLLRFDLIKKCVEYCKKNYPFKIPIFNTTTNGLLLDNEEILDFLIENNFVILVSLDGPKYSHDQHRLCISGKPSFDRVFENLHKFYMKDPKFFKTNVGFSSVRTAVNCGDDQYNFLDNLCKNTVFFTDSDNTEYFEKILESKMKNSEEKKIKTDVLKYNFMKENILTNMRKYHNSLGHKIKTYDVSPGGFCIPGIRKCFVTTDGKITLCEKVDDRQPEFILGDVFNGINTAKAKALCDSSTQKIQKCKDCWAAKFCGFCFKQIFNLTEEFCKKSTNDVYTDLKYYIEKIKDKKEVTTFLENMALE